MKTLKRKPDEPYQSVPAIHSAQLPPTLEQIRQRAHEIYLARGGTASRELDDLLKAERELQAGKNPFFND